MKLMMVNHGNVLHDPRASGLNKVWLLSGQTINIDDAWVAAEIKGQEYKLVPAVAGAIETPKSKWPASLLNRYTPTARPMTEERPAEESGTVEAKRRGRKKASDE